MERALELTVDYLRNRKQFGVTLGSFQALAHRAADLYVSVQLASALTSYAAAKYAAGEVDPMLATRAKFQVGRAARLVGQEAIQMHGGIGMTAEHAIGHYVTRLLAIEHTFGSTAEQLRVLTSRVREYDMVEL